MTVEKAAKELREARCHDDARQEEFRSQHIRLRQMLDRLIEWDATMGGFSAPVWKAARELQETCHRSDVWSTDWSPKRDAAGSN